MKHLGRALLAAGAALVLTTGVAQAQAVKSRVWPHFRGFDLNNIDYQWLAGHSAF
jgi:hypothetical protein